MATGSDLSPRRRSHSLVRSIRRGSASKPHRHAGREPRRIALPIETQAQRRAIMIADRPLGLPGRKRSERRLSSVTSAGCGWRAPAYATSTFEPTVRPCSRSSRALNDRHCLPAASTSTGWAGMDVLADLGDNNANNADAQSKREIAHKELQQCAHSEPDCR